MEQLKSREQIVLGVISDTHGLVRPEVLKALGGCSLIIHAGDIGNSGVVRDLRELAPVVAVRGNVDRGEWALEFPEFQELEIDTLRLFVIHNLKAAPFDLAEHMYDVVIFGHSHKAHLETRTGVLFLNPGSAGPRRFRLPVSLALLHIRGKSIDANILEIHPVP